MSSYSIGDMAQSFMLRRRGGQIKQDINRLSLELSSGRTADLVGRLGGNYSPLTDIERSMKILDGYKVAAAEATQFTEAMQVATERLQHASSELSSGLISTADANIPTLTATASDNARSELKLMMSALNTDSAGRSLFSGVATDQAPLADASTLLSALTAEVVTQTSVQDMVNAARAWFDSPTGFSAVVYQGSNQAMSPFELGDGEQVAIDKRANDPAFREVLMHTALAALANDPALALTEIEKHDMIKRNGEGLLSAQDDLTALRADVGYAQGRIETHTARNAAERTSTEYAKGALLAVDPYEAATRLEEVQFQLESLYSVTVRLSRLSLVSYMR